MVSLVLSSSVTSSARAKLYTKDVGWCVREGGGAGEGTQFWTLAYTYHIILSMEINVLALRIIPVRSAAWDRERDTNNRWTRFHRHACTLHQMSMSHCPFTTNKCSIENKMTVAQAPLKQLYALWLTKLQEKSVARLPDLEPRDASLDLDARADVFHGVASLAVWSMFQQVPSGLHQVERRRGHREALHGVTETSTNKGIVTRRFLIDTVNRGN